MATKLTTSNFSTATVALLTGATVTGVTVTDNTYTAINATAVSLSGGYIKITGTNFVSGASVYLDSTTTTSVTFVSSTQLNVVVPPLSTGTYILYVINGDGTIAIRVPGLTYSSVPSWNTNNTLNLDNGAISYQLSATSDSTIIYALHNGTTLPAGLTLSSTGLLSGTLNPADTTVYNFTVIATDSETQTSIQSFAVTITVGDEYFKLTTLLLNAQGPNRTALTPWIKDASTNNLAITSVGDAKASSITPYSTNWSNYFDGATSSGFRTLTNSNLNIASDGNVTIEFWLNTTVNSNNGLFGATDEAAWGATSWSFIYSSSAISLYNGNNGGSLWTIATPTLHDSQWHHVAIVRSSGTWQVFTDGVSRGTTTTQGTRTLGVASWRFAVGCIEPSLTDLKYTGSISNFRLTKSAVYTSNFTPSTTALTAITNTFLLTCQSNGIVDNSSQRLLFTTVSTTSPIVQYSNPFGTSLTGGSGYFDGTGDSLTAPQGSAFQFPGDFTIECWVYATNSVGGSSYDGIVDTRSGNVASSNSAGVNYKPDGYLNMYVGGTNTASSKLLGSKQWVHLALVRSGSAVTLYQNGVVVATATSTANLSDGYFTIGGFVSAGYWNGYISNVRVVKGVAVYTSAFSSVATAFPNLGTDDSYFNNTVLLLHGDGTNLANNNVFVDSSTNNFSITRNGNATQGAFSPFSQTGWSNFFNGTTDYLNSGTTPTNYLCTASTSGLATTFEAWVFPTSWNNVSGYMNNTIWAKGGTYAAFGLYNGTLQFFVNGGGTVSSSSSVPLNAWSYIAVTINGATVTFYINGVSAGSGTLTGGIPSAGSGTPDYIAYQAGGPSNSWFAGYISNFRISNIVRTISAVPTAAFTSDANTVVLSCQSNRFKDNSSNNFAITASGTPSVQALSPFLPTAAYDTSVVGGSGYFDRSGDYLTLAPGAAFAFGTGDFTVETWYYPTATPTDDYIIDARNAGQTDTWTFNFAYGGNNGELDWGTNGTILVAAPNTTSVKPYMWNHIAYTRTGTTGSLYVNGVRIATGTDSTNYATSPTISYVGSRFSAQNFAGGYFSGMRVVKGTAVYTGASYTVPTAPPTAITNTVLLLSGTNAGIIDSASKNVLETVGTARISTTQSKFGGSSIAFDGSTSSWLFVPHNKTLDLSTGTPDWTLECWGYVNSFSNSPYFFNKGGVAAAYYTNYSFSMNSSGVVFCTLGNNSGETSYSFGTCVINTWYHFAATRSGSTIRTFLNGVLVTTQTIATVMTDNGEGLYIGCLKNLTSNVLNGYVDDLRITRGVARYTAGGYFIPPTSLLTTTQSAYVSGNTTGTAVTGTATSLLTLQNAQPTQNSSFTDDSQNNFAITRNGNTTQGTFSPFSQTGWSVYNTGSSSYCQLNNADYSFGTGDFTVEFWMFVTSDKTYNCFCSAPSNPNFTMSLADGSTNSRNIYLEYGGGGTSISGVTNYLNTWTHIAVVRSSGTITVYKNGTSVGTASKSAAVGSTANLYLLRNSGDAGQDFPGYISNFRICKSAVYTSNFTPSTTPLTATSNTVLLTFQSNRFVDNSALNLTVTPTTTATQAFSPFAPMYITPTTYSNYFDGTGDYLTAPNAAWMNLGTGNFTIECWIQINTVTLTQMFVSSNYNAGTGAGGWAFLYRQDNTTLVFTCNSNVAYGKTWSPVVGTMYHVAVCRSGTSLRLFVNGVQIGTTSTSSDNIAGSSLLFIGSNVTNSLPINGVISNLRIVTSALYTANFTPPTAPLTAITNTQLLTCQSSTLADNSINAATFTAYGNVQPVTSPVPFAPIVTNTPYTKALIGGSGYFDGSGDYLSIASAAPLTLGTSDFTIELWWYPLQFNADGELFGSRTASNFCFAMYSYGSNGTLAAYAGTGGGSWDILNNLSMGTAIKNAWNHMALTRSGTTFSTYLNGVRISTATSSASLGGTTVQISGREGTAGIAPESYITGCRIIKGTALYTQNFATPISPLTAVTNTQLLLNYTNAGIIDNTAKNALETIGNAQISTVQSKYGGASIYFDGTGDYLSARGTPLTQMGTGAFTWECWCYITSATGFQGFIDTRTAPSSGSTTGMGLLLFLNTYTPIATTSDTILTSSISVTQNAWTHVALTRTSGGTLTIWVNGVSGGSISNSTNLTDNALWIGGNNTNPYPAYVNGYLDEIRITKGIARYTTTFEVPTQMPVR